MTSTVVALGLCLGLGLSLIAAWMRGRRPRLERRILPYVRPHMSAERDRDDLIATPFPTVERLLAPVIKDGIRAVEKWGSPAHEIRSRLQRAGSSLSVEQYRAEQVVWGVGGLAGGVLGSLVLAATRGSSPVALVVLTLAVAVAGAAARDYVLGRAVTKREARMVAELPTVAELLALSVSAGEGALGALERVSQTTRGVLADEMRATLSEARTGTPLSGALESLADRSGVPALRRFADGIATAVDRGTPLAEVSRAQAQDVRADGRRVLMEEGGKREIAMMVPVVFLILPVTVVFAVFPGLAALQLGT
ncbi:MAG: pilus assembly protein TadB [Actinobacteria bacterium HGW-Actinobacteria-4]|nr:MAG: pilus assembly protein TadB [Actinobacteria bacterium HGW-Actinobacteria-4]